MSKTNYLTIKAMGATCLLAMSSVSHAAITAFSDDFSGYAGPTMAPNWEGFSDNCGFPGGYSFAPSTSGPQISAIADDGGNPFWNVYGNYDNNACQDGAGPNPVENISLFRNFTYDGSDTASGNTVVFDFDYREAQPPFGPEGSTEVGAFIRVFDGAFNLLADATLDTSGSANWQSGQLSLVLNPIWVDGFFQVGFNNGVQASETSGMNYDNAALSIVPIPAAVWLFGSALAGMFGWSKRRAVLKAS